MGKYQEIKSKNVPRFSYNSAYSVYSRLIREKLKEIVKGDVNTFVDNDKLFVDIITNNYTHYRYTVYNVSDLIQLGVTCETVAQSIVKEYNKYIKTLYFY